MIVIEVHANSQVKVINYTDKKGNAAQMSKQDAYIHLTDINGNAKPYPEAVSLSLPKSLDGRPRPYAAGRYTLHPSSFYLDKYQGIVVAPKLVPIDSKA